MTIGIYKIYFSKTPNKIYVGSSKACEKRKSQHLKRLRKGVHINGWLQYAFNKHGQDKFVFEIIEIMENFDRNSLIEREKFHYYQALDSGFTLYNAIIPEISPTNTGRTRFKKGLIPWNTGKKILKHVREAISKANKGRPSWNKGVPCSEETRKKLSLSLKGKKSWNKGMKTGKPAWNKGKTMSVEYRKKLSEAHKGQAAWNKGKTMSEEHCKKLSEAHKGKGKDSWFKNKSLLPI
jgi:group I intron endonuclease